MSRFRFLRLNLWLVLAGVVVATAWIFLADGPEILPGLARIRPQFLPPLLGLTAFCLFVRFVRWQYLLRRVDVRVPARAGLSIFLASLTGIATPAYAGEILRGIFLRRRFGAPLRVTTFVLVVERLLDVAALALIATITSPAGWLRSLMILLLAVAALGGVATARLAFGFGTPPPVLRQIGRPLTLVQAFLLSLLAWAPATLLVSLAAASLGGSIGPLTGMSIFSTTTLFGGISLMPAGVGSMGSLAILRVQELGFTLTDSVVIISLVRLLSTGVSLAVGAVFLLVQIRAGRRDTAGAAAHFDDIAPEYTQQFSTHIWNLLLQRRSRLLREAIDRQCPDGGGIGLDLGCGLGQQALALQEQGYHVVGIDAAHALVHRAAAAGATALTADLRALPFADASLDFVYTIGVLHHLSGAGAQDDATREVARVLKPGGLFIIQETNPRNPLFRFYMGYIFPIIKSIDEGTEWWINPHRWQNVRAMQLLGIRYFSFLPDFAPRLLLRPLLAIERLLESSFMGHYAVHYMATLRKEI